jgi:hypothetical protein
VVGFFGVDGKLMERWEKEVFWGRVTGFWVGRKLCVGGFEKTKPEPASLPQIIQELRRWGGAGYQ